MQSVVVLSFKKKYLDQANTQAPNGKYPLSLRENVCFMNFSFASCDWISTNIYPRSIFRSAVYAREKKRNRFEQKTKQTFRAKKNTEKKVLNANPEDDGNGKSKQILQFGWKLSLFSMLILTYWRAFFCFCFCFYLCNVHSLSLPQLCVSFSIS